jgi:hypothetical protein
MSGFLFRMLCALLAVSLTAQAGEPVRRTPRSTDPPDIQQITQRAALIFLGRVESIQWKHAAGGGPGDRVRITFRVLDGIRGAKTGEVVEVQEWSGLWAPGRERYRLGETVLLFLHAPSRLGLTSPVGGDAGRLEITPARRVLLSPERMTALLPRSLRLQKQQVTVEQVRSEGIPHYEHFARIVRELAGAPPR